MTEDALGARKQPTEIVDKVVGTDPGGAARKQAATFVGVVAGARRRLAEREAVAQHVLRRSGRGTAAATLGAIEAEVAVTRAIDHPAASAEDGTRPARGGVPGARLEPRRRRPAKVDLAMLLDHDVELRTLGGGLFRGQLIAVTKEYALLERRTGRLALIRLAAVAAACDENYLGGT